MKKHISNESTSSQTSTSQESDVVLSIPIINLAPKKLPKGKYEKVKNWIQKQINKDTRYRRYNRASSIKRKKKVIKKGKWSTQENKLLKEWVKVHGAKNWEACGRYIQGRSGKQCREHWNNCLNPELIKGDWTSEEDFLIMFFYEKCQGSWKKIIPLFNGRIENSIKNRFYSQLRKYATQHMTTKERKELCAKIKLVELKKYLNKALSESKKEFLKTSKMTKEQFNSFLLENELKIKDNLSEYNDNNEGNLSTNLEDSLFNQEKNENENLNKKRKRSDIVLLDDFIDFKNDDFTFDENSFNDFLGINEDKNNEINGIISINIFNDKETDNVKEDSNNNIIQYNHIDNNLYVINNNLDIYEDNVENKNDLSMDYIECIQNNNLRNIFPKEYKREKYSCSDIEKFNNFEQYFEGFNFAFNNNVQSKEEML